MMKEEEKLHARHFLGKTVVSKAGKRFGEVSNILFEPKTGELIQLSLKNPTGFTEGLDLEKDGQGNFLVPFSAVLAVGDFVVISEEDII